MAKPMFLEKFEELHGTLAVLAAQHDLRPVPPGATPQAVEMLAAEAYEKNRVLLGEVKQVVHALGEACEVLRDLEMARDPDVEQLARMIFAAGHSARPVKADQAFAAAQEYIDVRNRRRDAQASSSALAKK